MQSRTTRNYSSTNIEQRKMTVPTSLDIISQNVLACSVIASITKSLLGPKSREKMLVDSEGHVTLSNDGATVLTMLKVDHPAAKLLVQLSRSMDIQRGDGTTSVVILASALLTKALELLKKGVHPMMVIRGYTLASKKIIEVLNGPLVSYKFDPNTIEGKQLLISTATTTLASKLVSHIAPDLSKIAVEVVLEMYNRNKGNASIIELNQIKIIGINGGSVKDSTSFPGLMLEGELITKGATSSGSPTMVALFQFCLDRPRPSESYKIVAESSTHIDRLIREEQHYIKDLVVKIKKLGIGVVVVQDSVMGKPISDTASHWLSKAGILGIILKRSEIELLCTAIEVIPFTGPEMLSKDTSIGRVGTLKSVSQLTVDGRQLIKFEATPKPFSSIILRGPSSLLAEAERAFHDAICTVRNMLEQPVLVLGGGATEINISLFLEQFSTTIEGVSSYAVRCVAEALEEIPITLASNSGMDPLLAVTHIRNHHLDGRTRMGVNVFAGEVQDMQVAGVWEPLINKQAQISMACETAISVLKIDDVIRI